MGLTRPTPPSVEAYLAASPPLVRRRLQEIRDAIRRVVPEATETISYGIPAFVAGGSAFIYFAGYEKHVGVYPVSPELPGLAAELAPYASGKATVRFPLDSPIPADLVSRIVQVRLEQHAARSRARRPGVGPKRGQGE